MIMKRLIFLLLPVAMILAVVNMGCSSGNSPKGTVKAFYKNCLDGNYTKAFSYTNVGEMGQMMVEKAGAEMADMGLDKFKIVSVEYGNTSNTATVDVIEYYQKKDGKTIEKKNALKLYKIDGRWKISLL